MGRAHAEDVGEDGDVGGEGKVVVGYSQGHGQALARLIAKQAFASGLSNSTVVRRTLEGQASVTSLHIEAALIHCAHVCSRHTFVNILAAASVGCQGVTVDRAGTMEAARGVVTAIGANMTSSRKGTFINVFTSHAINVTELVAPAAVALVGAVHIGTLLTTWIALTLVHIVTIPAVTGQLEARCTAARVGSKGVLTLVGAQAARVVPAFIDIFTNPSKAVEDVSGCTLTAEGAHQVDTTVT